MYIRSKLEVSYPVGRKPDQVTERERGPNKGSETSILILTEEFDFS